jgi:hypothetical protein
MSNYSRENSFDSPGEEPIIKIEENTILDDSATMQLKFVNRHSLTEKK